MKLDKETIQANQDQINKGKKDMNLILLDKKAGFNLQLIRKIKDNNSE